MRKKGERRVCLKSDGRPESVCEREVKNLGGGAASANRNGGNLKGNNRGEEGYIREEGILRHLLREGIIKADCQRSA